MAYDIVPGSQSPSGKTTFTRAGITSHQEYLADTWDEAILNMHYPGYESPYWPGMTLDTTTIQGEGAAILDEMGNPSWSIYRVIEDYSLDYRKLRIGDPPKVSMSLGAEMLSTGEGRLYADTLRSVPPGMLDAVPYPAINVSIDYACTAAQLPQGLVSLAGAVNIDSFPLYSYDSGLPVLIFEAMPETLLFEGADQTAQLDYDTYKWYYRITLKMIWRPFSHNLVYAAPEYKVNKSGCTLIYQDIDAAITATYTTDATKVSLPIPLAGVAGTGRWTTNIPPLHTPIDFGSLVIT